MAEKEPFTFEAITRKMALQLRRSGADSLCGTREDEDAAFFSSLTSEEPTPRKQSSNTTTSDAPRKKAKKMRKNYEILPPIDERAHRTVEVTPVSRVERVTPVPPPPPAENGGLDVFGLVRILIRRRIWIYIGGATMLAAAALVCLVMTPEYAATSRLQLLSQEMGRLSLKDGADGSGGYDFYSTLQTYVTVMQSDTLALQVIKELNLENEPGFRYNPLIKTDEAKRQMAAPMDQAPLKRAAILKRFKASLLVDAMAGTRLVTVSYKDSDPEMAAKVVNQLVQDFVEYNFKVGYNATTKATDFLSKQLVDLKAEVEKSQERAVELQKSSGILGTDEHDNIIVTRLEQLNSELTAAQANRIVKEAVYNQARMGNPEQIAGLVAASGGDSGSGSAPDLLSLISHLRQQESDLKTEYADAATKYGPAYPKLIEMKERLATLQTQIQTQLNKVLETAKSDYQVAAAREANAKQLFEEQKALATKMNDRAIDYTIARHEAESNRVLYDNLEQKLKEADLLAGLRSSELNIVDIAVAPGRPNKPRVPLYLAAGLMAGLALGVVAAFVVEAMDRTMRNPDVIESTTQIPILGIIPQGQVSVGIEAKDWLKAYAIGNGTGAAQNAALVLGPDNCAVAEAFRWVRTSLLLSNPQDPPRVFMLASATAGEGKSFTSLNLAAALAQNGGKVLLVDADLRRGTLSKILKKSAETGLSEALLGDSQPRVYQQLEELPGLTFLPAGALLNSPAELLGSSRMTRLINIWRRDFSYVVIDTPALLPVTDAVVLSPQVDIVIMVARFAYTQSQAIVRAVRLLRGVQVKNIGVLVNAMDTQSAEYSHYSGSYGYAAYTNEDQPQLVNRSSRRGRGGQTT